MILTYEWKTVGLLFPNMFHVYWIEEAWAMGNLSPEDKSRTTCVILALCAGQLGHNLVFFFFNTSLFKV